MKDDKDHMRANWKVYEKVHRLVDGQVAGDFHWQVYGLVNWEVRDQVNWQANWPLNGQLMDEFK